jgi:hypothetical protein
MPHKRKREKRESGQSPFKPVELTPMSLRQERARDVPSVEVTSREMPLASIGDHAQPARPVSSQSFAFTPLSEIRPEMRLELARSVALITIPVSPIQMQELRERRIAARQLGWVIPGYRITTR